MFIRGEGSMVSLQDASRRLQVPVDVIWRWITEGKLAAEIKPGRGLGMEYYLDPGEMKRARELRDQQLVAESDEHSDTDAAPSNIISLDFTDLSGSTSQQEPHMSARSTERNEAVSAMENLRSDALAAIDRQVGRESAIDELAAAVEALMNDMLDAMDRAQDVNHGRLAAELETMRLRLSRQIQDRERDDLRLRDQLAASKRELATAMERIQPSEARRTGVSEEYHLGASNGDAATL